ncbi:virulence associated lipoprotein [Borrelia duttonii]|uniref:Uncharacterized conserved protein n=1 Tax=Borrelia duttonii (strain Ly) TaxID=412419 RepID=B5RN79_BORDL|nr:uncharacterized conserved protein [Borrelia duttonii Ly]
MKQKVFVIFVLISLLLIACDPRGKTVDYAKAKRIQKEKVEQIQKAEKQRIREAEEQRKLAEEVRQRKQAQEEEEQFELEAYERELELKREEEEQRKLAEEARQRKLKQEEKERLKQEEEERLKQEEISVIKKEITPSISAVLKNYNNTALDESKMFLSVSEIKFAFSRLSYKTVGGKEFLYDGTTPGDVSKESIEARKEVYLIFEYNVGLVRTAVGIFEGLYFVPLVTGLFGDLLKKSRKCAKAYYVDVYDFLQKNQDKLNTLSLEHLKLLKVRLAALTKEQLELKNYLKRGIDLFSLQSRLAGIQSRCNEVIERAGSVKEILNKIQ